MGDAIRQSEFDKLRVALDSTEFALRLLQNKAVELRRKRDSAKTQEELVSLDWDAAELLQRLRKSARQFIPAILHHISGFYPK